MDKSDLSAVIITKNEEKNIKDCIKSASFIKDIIIIDNGSTDKTSFIAESMGVKVFSLPLAGFSQLRDFGLHQAKGKWILYLDADERIDHQFSKELTGIVCAKASGNIVFYAIPRRNFILGKEMRHGGWWPDYVKRLFLRSALKGWKGDLHEEPVILGKIGYFKSPLIHQKHQNISEMVEKTNKWSEIEAKLLYGVNHPKMTWWRFFRMMLTEFYIRIIRNKGFLDGSSGIIYGLYQVWSRYLTYAKLWEMQIKKT